MSKINVTVGIITGKKDARGLVPIYLFIYKGREILKKQSLSQKIRLDWWLPKEKRVYDKAPNAKLINSVIERKIAEYEKKILQETIISGSPDIVAILHREKVREIDFYAFAEEQIQQKNYADETRRNYRVYVEKLKAFRKYLKLAKINYKFLQEYECYLRDTLKNSVNTVWGNIKFINTLVKDAVKMKYLVTDPFDTYNRPKYKQTERTFLTEDELNRIAEEVDDTKDESLKTVGRFFLLMCYTGLRFSDATRLTFENILNDERIVIQTKKTGQNANIYINERIRPLLIFTVNKTPGIGQVDFNRKLKALASAARIAKKVSSHVGRHTFGASLVSAGVSEKVAQGLLTHVSAASTKIYYHLQTPALDEAMKRFNKPKT